MPYTPILNMAQILESTLYLIEHTDYPHKDHLALEHVKRALCDALEAIREVEPLQAEVTGKPVQPASVPPTANDPTGHKPRLVPGSNSDGPRIGS